MRFADMKTDLRGRMNRPTGLSTEIEIWLNQAQDEIQVFFPWPFLITEEFVQTVAKHTDGTGTINVTNGSTAVSGTGTSWTAAMTGRKFRVTSDNEWYTFTRTAATTGTLDRNYEGTTSTTADYVIFQDIFRTHGDVNQLKLFRNLGQQRTFVYASNSEFDRAVPTITQESEPRIGVVRGRDTSTYSTGTVSGTAGAKVITGAASPAWTSVEGLTRGIKIRVENQTYTINTIDSDTQITIYENLATTISAGTAYTINLNNILVQFWPPPADSIGVPYKYIRIMPPLVNDWDESQVPEKYHRLIIEGGLKRAFMYQFDSAKYQLAKAEFNEGLLLMKADFRQTIDKVNVLGSSDRIRRQDAFLLPLNLGTLS